VQQLHCLDLLVCLYVDARKKGRDLLVAGAQLLEEVDAGCISAGGVDVVEKTGGEVVRNEIGNLDLRIRAQLPACTRSAI
jgi:hypothetical protein